MLTLSDLRRLIQHEVARSRLLETATLPKPLTAGDLVGLLRDVDPDAPVFVIDPKSGATRAMAPVRAGDVTVEDAGGYTSGDGEFDDLEGPIVCISARTP